MNDYAGGAGRAQRILIDGLVKRYGQRAVGKPAGDEADREPHDDQDGGEDKGFRSLSPCDESRFTAKTVRAPEGSSNS